MRRRLRPTTCTLKIQKKGKRIETGVQQVIRFVPVGRAFVLWRESY